jgi:hypothetical protein
MLVKTSAPIYEENSNANGKRKKGQFKKKFQTGFQKGYTKIKDAGALPVIESLLGLQIGSGVSTVGTGAEMPQNTNITPPPTEMSTTKKVVIGALILGAIVGAYFYFKAPSPKKATVKPIK